MPFAYKKSERLMNLSRHKRCIEIKVKLDNHNGIFSFKVIPNFFQRKADPGITAVISNNILCINKDQNVFDSKVNKVD